MRDFTSQERLWLWLNSVTAHYIKKFHLILEQFSDIEEVYEEAHRKNESAFHFLDEKTRHKLFHSATEEYINQYVRWLNKHEVDIVLQTSDNYPALLKEIEDPPAILFIRGHLVPNPTLPIAMIGMRNCSDYGTRITKQLATGLAEQGATIISGMARGIDSWASRGALDCKTSDYPTIAVLGSGVDVIYPPENARLYYEIIERGAVISEFLPSTQPHASHFPVRNRVISGLSRGVVVVQAGKRSGTSITVNYALDQGRDVFAVPGQIDDIHSVGINALIQTGSAKPIFGISDILEEYGFYPEEPLQIQPKKIDLFGLNDMERSIVEQLIKGERNFDELCELLSYSPAELNSTLTSLEFSEIIKQLPGRIYKV